PNKEVEANGLTWVRVFRTLPCLLTEFANFFKIRFQEFAGICIEFPSLLLFERQIKISRATLFVEKVNVGIPGRVKGVVCEMDLNINGLRTASRHWRDRCGVGDSFACGLIAQMSAAGFHARQIGDRSVPTYMEIDNCYPCSITRCTVMRFDDTGQ